MSVDIQRAHQLLDQFGPGQLAAVVNLLETMVRFWQERQGTWRQLLSDLAIAELWTIFAVRQKGPYWPEAA